MQSRFEELRIDLEGVVKEVKQEMKLLSAGALFSPTSIALVYRQADLAGKMKRPTAPEWWEAAADSVWSARSLGDPLPPGTEESRVQQVLERFFRSLERLPDSKLCLQSRSATPSLGTRKPDVVGFLAQLRTPQVAGGGAAGSQQGIAASSNDPVHIVCLGEAKSRRVQGAEGVFTDQEKGHTLSFAEELVRRQPWRAKPLAGGGGLFRPRRHVRNGQRPHRVLRVRVCSDAEWLPVSAAACAG